MIPTVNSIDHLVLTVADIAATSRFYETILGMQIEQFRPADGSERTAVKFGSQKINLHLAGSEFDPKARTPGPGTADLCFLSGTSINEWQSHLATNGIPIEIGPIQRTGATGPILSIYVRDPDANLIEISNPI